MAWLEDVIVVATAAIAVVVDSAQQQP